MLEAFVLASGLTTTVDSISRRNDIVTAVVRTTNSGATAYNSVYLECGFLDVGGKAVKASADIVNNLQPGQTAYSNVQTVDQGHQVSSVECRIGLTQP